MTLTVYYANSWHNMVARWMLEEVGKPYDLLPAPRHTQRDTLVLEHDGVFVSGVVAICAHLADQFPEARLNVPQSNPSRDAYLEWLRLGESWMALPSDAAARESDFSVITLLDRVADAVKSRSYLLGDEFKMIDIIIGSSLRIGLTAPALSRRPQLLRYAGRLAQRPAFKYALQRERSMHASAAENRRIWTAPPTPLGYAFPPASAESPIPVHDATLVTTEEVVEGPYYLPQTPQRTVVRNANSVGRSMVLEGHVRFTDGRPAAQAVIDIWSCDANGVYGDQGQAFNLRGHQFTDADGRYRFETVRPGAYLDQGRLRTPHVHVKVQGRNTPLLTTQLYFPDEPLNTQDILFMPSLVVALSMTADLRLRAQFDFVLPAP